VGRVRVLLVDDSRLFVEGLMAWFDGDPFIRIVGAAPTGMDALDMAERLRPDLVLVDVRMHPMGGFEVLRHLKADPAAPPVVLTTFVGDDTVRRAAAEAGADRFFDKSEVVEGLSALARRMLGA
jgi:DNA-binding NarL/FixJ family response regulator